MGLNFNKNIKIFLFAILFIFGIGTIYALAVGVPEEYARMSQDSLLTALHRNGYWEAKVDSTKNDTIFVSLGKPVIVESLDVVHSDSFSVSLEGKIFIAIGDTVKSAKIFSQQEQFVSLLENSGYPFASCTTAVNVSEREKYIGVFLKFIVEGGNFVRLQCLNAKVDGKTKQSVIAHLMLFHPDEIYRQKYIDAGAQRLRRVGIVALLGNPYPALDPKGEWTLVVKAKDLPTTSISGVLGYADDVLSGDFEFSAKNIFGTGRATTFSIYASEADRQVELSYREPFIASANIAPQLYSYWEKHDSTYFRREHKLGVEFPLSFEIDGYVGFITSRTSPGTAGASLSQSESFGLEGQIKFSTLDNPLLPRKGFYANGSATAEYIHRWGNEDIEEPGSKGEASALAAIPLAKWLSLWAKVAGSGWLAPILPPQTDWKFLGGWENLRGYRENQFSGSRLVWASAEPRIILQNTFHIFPFVDFGAFRDNEKWNTKIGYGGGIEYFFGTGVFSIEYGIGEDRTFSSGLLHFGIRMAM